MLKEIWVPQQRDTLLYNKYVYISTHTHTDTYSRYSKCWSLKIFSPLFAVFCFKTFWTFHTMERRQKQGGVNGQSWQQAGGVVRGIGIFSWHHKWQLSRNVFFSSKKCKSKGWSFLMSGGQNKNTMVHNGLGSLNGTYWQRSTVNIYS